MALHDNASEASQRKAGAKRHRISGPAWGRGGVGRLWAGSGGARRSPGAAGGERSHVSCPRAFHGPGGCRLGRPWQIRRQRWVEGKGRRVYHVYSRAHHPPHPKGLAACRRPPGPGLVEAHHGQRQHVLERGVPDRAEQLRRAADPVATVLTPTAPGQVSGSIQRRPAKRAKSVSQEHSSAPCSRARVAKWASVVRLPAAPSGKRSPLSKSKCRSVG